MTYMYSHTEVMTPLIQMPFLSKMLGECHGFLELENTRIRYECRGGEGEGLRRSPPKFWAKFRFF